MKFDLNLFSFLNDQEFDAGWTNLGQSDLDAITNEIFESGSAEEGSAVLSAIDEFSTVLTKMQSAIVGEYHPESLLGIHADEMGLLDVVLGPAVFQNEDGSPVIKTGDNLFAVDFTKGAVTCGELSGDLAVVEVGDDGKKVAVLALDVFATDDETIISISCVLAGDEESRPTIGRIKKAITNGTWPTLLKPIPKGGGFIKMNDLKPKTEYLVTALEERPTHEEYGRSWTITLAGVGDVISKGKRFEAGLAQNATRYKKLLADGKPLTLLVSKVEKIASGIQVSAGFFKRAPRAEFAFKPALKSAAPAELPALGHAIEVESVLIPETETADMLGSF